MITVTIKLKCAECKRSCTIEMPLWLNAAIGLSGGLSYGAEWDPGSHFRLPKGWGVRFHRDALCPTHERKNREKRTAEYYKRIARDFAS
jgi:hypothetical protein